MQINKQRFKITPAVYLYLEKNNKILLQKRFNTGYHDGEYSMVAGHLDGGETFTQAIIRETKEEAGIILPKKTLKIIHIMHRKDIGERLDAFIRASSWQNKIKNMEPHKCDDLSWFDLNKLPKNIIPYIKFVIKQIRKNIFYSEFGWRERCESIVVN